MDAGAPRKVPAAFLVRNPISLGSVGCNLDCDFCQAWQYTRLKHVNSEYFEHHTAEEIIDRAKQFEAGIPVVIAGDFNAGTESKPYRLLSAAFMDTFQKLHPTVKEAGTFNGFKGESHGARIDLIFSSQENEILAASIDRRDFNGRTPSDHFPVTSVLRIKSD